MEKIASLLVEKGITPTKQRLELAELIFDKINTSQHQIFSKVEEAGFDIFKQLYNTLWLFEERNAKDYRYA